MTTDTNVGMTITAKDDLVVVEMRTADGGYTLTPGKRMIFDFDPGPVGVTITSTVALPAGSDWQAPAS